MRLSTGGDVTEAVALTTIRAAVEAGVTIFDTARAYGRDGQHFGENEALVARALREAGAGRSARIITKGGMTRTGSVWTPDGRARTIRADCEASLRDLAGLPIDLYLLHAPDPRTPWRTSLRALTRLVDEGLVGRVGVCNVNRAQLDEALDLAPVSAVQVPLSVHDDRAVRGGILDRCTERGIALVAYSPLGGVARARGLARDRELADCARRLHATPAEVALAWLLQLSPVVVAIPGARTPATARSAARAASLQVDDEARAAITGRLAGAVAATSRRGKQTAGEVVVVMGIPGAGKSTVAQEYVARAYSRLNRDQLGGSLRALADTLNRQLGTGVRGVVLDNTYLTRAARSYVVETAASHGLPVRCLWIDITLPQAQVNMVLRLLDRFGHLPSPEELRSLTRAEPGLLSPTSQMRALRELEPPAVDEGFASIERIVFSRRPPSRPGRAAVFVAAAAVSRDGLGRALATAHPAAPHLIFDWVPGAGLGALGEAAAAVSAAVTGPVSSALCPHGGGPPTCWCRPPLPGLLLEFSRLNDVEVSASILVGTTPAHRTLAATLGARYVAA